MGIEPWKRGESTFHPSPVGSVDVEELMDRIESAAARVDRLTLRCRIVEAACACLAALVIGSWLMPKAADAVPREFLAGRIVGSEILANKITVADDKGRPVVEIGGTGRNGVIVVRDLASGERTYIDHEGAARFDADDRPLK